MKQSDRGTRLQKICEKASKGKGLINKPRKERKPSKKRLRGKFETG